MGLGFLAYYNNLLLMGSLHKVIGITAMCFGIVYDVFRLVCNTFVFSAYILPVMLIRTIASPIYITCNSIREYL